MTAGSTDYARIADLYDDFVRSEFDVAFFVEEARKSRGEVLELMAGTGRVSVPLAEAGVRLTCVDRSPEMLALLEEKLERRGLSATVVEADVREMDLARRFDLVIIPFHSFAELVSLADQGRVLAVVREHLTDGGRFVCTLHNPDVRLKRVDGALRLWARRPRRGGDGELLVWGLEDLDPGEGIVTGLEFFEEYGADGVLLSRRMLEVRFRLLSKAAFLDTAGAAGFDVDALYGDYSRTPFREEDSPYMIWLLRRARVPG